MEAKRVYLDSSIWISHILQEKRNNRAQTVQQLFHQIEEDEGVILISHLVLLEVLEVIRKRITENEPYTDLGDDKRRRSRIRFRKRRISSLKSSPGL